MEPVNKKIARSRFPLIGKGVDGFWGADHFLDDDFSVFRKSWTPAVNIREHDRNFEIEVAAPGLEKEDFNIELENDMLCISVEKEENNEIEDENYTRKEFSFRSFARFFNIPDNVDTENISAKYEKGILKLTLKKIRIEKPKVKKIAIS